MHLGYPNVAALPQPATLDGLGVRAFHAGSRGVLLLEFLCPLLSATTLFANEPTILLANEMGVP